MESKQFIKTISKLMNEWLNHTNLLINNGSIKTSWPYSYNHILRVAESSTHFVCELCGSKKYKPNEIISIQAPKKPERLRNTTSFFWSTSQNSNHENAMVNFFGEKNGISQITLGLKTGQEKFDSLAEALNLSLLDTKLIGDVNKFDVPIFIGPENNYVLFNNIDIFETDGACIHYRIISSALVLKKPVDEKELQKFFTISNLQAISAHYGYLGINRDCQSSIKHFSEQLLSMSGQDTKESIIDNFIQQHGNYFAKALGYKKFISQQKLKWIRRMNMDPEESIPDFLMEREDGYYDILDIKTGAMKYKSITKSKKSGKNGKIRIRFIDYTSELIAQLKDYERYFSYPENIEYAYKTYGVKIKNPKLLGIIGNYNNFNREEVDRSIDKENIVVLSYFDIRNLLRKCSVDE